MALLMLVLGVLSFALMNVDIFPAIDLPVVMVVWNYPGLSAIDVERRMVFISERAYSTTVNGIEHIESQSINGLGILKVYFQPGADLGAAIAQINAVSETILTILPRGTEPPQIISYNAGNVPVAQLNIFSDTLSTSRLFDYGLNFIRLQLFTIPGFSSPAPLGGVQRAVMVNLDPTALYANGLSPHDIGNALDATNVVIPAGTAKIGDHEYNVDLNMSVPQGQGFQSPAGQVRQRHAGFPGRCRAGHRHPSAADQRGARRRQAGDLSDGHQARRGFDPGVVDAVKAKIPHILRHRAQGPESLAHLRPVAVRARRVVGRGAGSGDRRRAGRAHGAGVPRLAAQHADRDHLDSAVDPDRDHRAEAVRPDDQHHDAGRNRARGRHAGR